MKKTTRKQQQQQQQNTKKHIFLLRLENSFYLALQANKNKVKLNFLLPTQNLIVDNKTILFIHH